MVSNGDIKLRYKILGIIFGIIGGLFLASLLEYWYMRRLKHDYRKRRHS